MSSQEIPLTITPQQAAYGVILTVTLATGPARLRIPPCADGDLVRVRVGAAEVPVRIRVGPGAGVAPGPSPAPAPVPEQSPAPAPAPPPSPTPAPAPARAAAPAAGNPYATTPFLTGAPAPGTPWPPAPVRSGPAGSARARGFFLVAIGVLGVLGVAVVAGVALLGDGDPGTSAAAPYATPSAPTSTPDPTAADGPSSPAPAPPPAPAATDTPAGAVPDPVPPSAEAAPTPFDQGTCLNGSLPDSTTAQSVSGVDEVPCSASDAHYRVIESIPMTSDMDRCDDNPKTEYAFSHSYTLNGVPINEYVYCLVGIGSYARG